MDEKHLLRRRLGPLVVALALIGGVWWMWRPKAPSEPSALIEVEQAPVPSSLVPGRKLATKESVVTKVDEPLSEEEQYKLIDREHMTKIHGGLMAYRKDHGNFPAYLSQLVPDYVDAKVLGSPRKPHGRSEHEDPNIENPAYGFEFSNVVYRDGRTFEEIKEVQRAEWGDAVPILRAFDFSGGVVLNMSYGGELYETLLNWEWDPNTLDVVDELGWGTGLTDGEFSEVQVKDAEGEPVAGAEVWASGRHYSFDLPDRPFLTDADGVARIPIGVDMDRTQLGLRVRTEDGQVAPSVRYPNGEPPADIEFTLSSSQNVGGQVVADNGEPLADTWIYLTNAEANTTLGTVKTNAEGAWETSLHPNDIAGLHAVVAAPGVVPKFVQGAPVDALSAAQGNAIIAAPPSAVE